MITNQILVEPISPNNRMQQSVYRTKAQYNSFVRKFLTQFLIATFLAYSSSFLWNCIIYFFTNKFKDNPELSITPIIERWIVWNSIFFSIFLSIAKLIIRHYTRIKKQKYNINVVLKRYRIIQIIEVSIITQFFVFFTPKGFLLYLIIPVHCIISFILNKFKGRK